MIAKASRAIRRMAGKYTKHFSVRECRCKCGRCLKNRRMNMIFMEMLEVARVYANLPFYPNSADRCPYWNEHEGGSDDSAHMHGLAMDILCNNDQARLIIVMALLHAGFRRIRVAKTFIHVDLDDQVLRSHPNGKYRKSPGLGVY